MDQTPIPLPPPPPPRVDLRSALLTLRQFRWFRGHVSTFAVGSVLLLTFNLLLPVRTVWAATLIGMWGVIVIAHLIVIAMARLGLELLEDDTPPRRVQMAPWRPAQYGPPPPSGWRVPPEDDPARAGASAHHGERMSWKSATDAAWLNRPREDDGAS